MVLVLWGVGVIPGSGYWNFGTGLCCIDSGKWDVGWVLLRGLDIGCMVFWGGLGGHLLVAVWLGGSVRLVWGRFPVGGGVWRLGWAYGCWWVWCPELGVLGFGGVGRPAGGWWGRGRRFRGLGGVLGLGLGGVLGPGPGLAGVRVRVRVRGVGGECCLAFWILFCVCLCVDCMFSRWFILMSCLALLVYFVCRTFFLSFLLLWAFGAPGGERDIVVTTLYSELLLVKFCYLFACGC